MKCNSIRQAVAKQLGWKKVRSRKFARCRQALMAGGFAIAVAGSAQAVPVLIPDHGFEDHVVDDVSGYAYGGAGQAGDPDGFNNPSSSGGGISPWQALASGGNGVAGDNASWIFNAGYAAVNSGDQAAEVQGLFAQNLSATFTAGMNYFATVAAAADGGDGNVVVSLYDAGAVALEPTSTPDTVLSAPSLVTATPVVTSGPYSDETFTFSASSLAGLVGKNIGIAVYAPDTTGQGPWIDDIRLEASAFEMSLRVTIDRDTGTMTLNNGQLAAQDIQGYSILSSAGALLETNFTPMATGDSDWVQFTADGATSDLSEGHLTTGSLAVGASIMLDDGSNGAWSQYYDEDDIRFEYLDGNGNLIAGTVTFTGSEQTVPFAFGDLNFDGSFDGLDWDTYVAGLGTDLSGMSAAQSYPSGDLNGDQLNNHADFVIFKTTYDAAHGSGAFQAMIAGVPEPSTIAIAMLGWVGFTGIGSRRRG